MARASKYQVNQVNHQRRTYIFQNLALRKWREPGKARKSAYIFEKLALEKMARVSRMSSQPSQLQKAHMPIFDLNVKFDSI